jgi:hypothetical protein
MRTFAVLAALALLALTACPKPAPTSTTPTISAETLKAEEAAKAQPDPRVLDDDRKCTSDADCTLATSDCCGCNALGSQTGVRKDHVADLANRRAPVCAGVACGQGMSDDPSCTATKAVCKAGLCVPNTVATTSKTPTAPIP